MKSNVAVALSVAGVLAAGTAAALVNTQVLSGSESAPASAAAAEILLPTTTSPGAPVVVGAATSTSTTPGATTASSTATAAAAGVTKTLEGRSPATTAATGTQAVYEIGTSGTVTLDSAGGVLRVVAIEPAAGWTVRANEQRSDQRIHVTFASGSIEVDFDADLVLGVVGTSVASRDLSAPATTLPSSGGGDDHDDDRDDAEYEDDDDHDDDDADDYDDDSDDDHDEHEEDEDDD